MKKWMAGLCAWCVFTGCEKNINLSTRQQQPELVVDASIENGKPPLVVLSNSLNYFSTISPAQLQASFVHGAQVTVGDGTVTAKLNEFSQSDSAGYTVYYYSVDTAGGAAALLGVFSKQYQLDITTADGKTYTATTTIPVVAKTMDSIWWEATTDQALCSMWGRFTDPKGLGNYIRYFTRVNSQPFLTAVNSVFDDEFTDGTTYNLQFNLGYDRNTENSTSSTYGYAHHGDTVTVKFCNIDKATFTFWNTWEFSLQSNNNPFSSPVTVIGNVSNGALGAFSGYGAQYKTIIIPK